MVTHAHPLGTDGAALLAMCVALAVAGEDLRSALDVVGGELASPSARPTTSRWRWSARWPSAGTPTRSLAGAVVGAGLGAAAIPERLRQRLERCEELGAVADELADVHRR